MKTKSTFNLIIRLLSFLGKNLGLVLIATINGTLGFILAMNISIFAGLTIMKYLGLFDGISYEILFTIIILSGVLRGILRYGEQYFNHFLAFKLLAFLRHKIFYKLCKISLNKIDDKDKSNIVSIIQADVETLEIFYAHTISPFLIAIITCAIVVVFVSLFTSIYIGLSFIAGYLIIGLLIPYIFYKFNGNIGMNYRKKLAKAKSFFTDSIYGRNDIILNNNKQEKIREVDYTSLSLIKESKRIDLNNVIFKNLTMLIIIILNVCVVLVGYLLVENNILVNYKILLAFICFISSFGPVIALANLPYNLAMTFASGQRIFDLLDEQEIINEGKINNLSFYNLAINNISFSYRNYLVLNNLSLNIGKNEIIGIFGESGSGKSTLLKLIMHFYNVNNGEIKINNLNINDISYDCLYDNINLFSQTTYLFKDSIWNNLVFVKPDASKDEVIEACKNANIYDYIQNLENGLETQINDLIDNLSSGEKQRIGLARVLLKKPKLLLLDEATSNIDALNEASILKALLNIKNETSIIIVSHRLSTLSICDKIYKLENQKLNLMSK